MQNHILPRPCLAAALGAALLASSFGSTATPADREAASPVDSAKLIARLAAGNDRFVQGTSSHADQSAERRQQVAAGQQPYAIVLTCADSRVSPELLFDEGLGNLFVIRNAGNLLDDHVLASMEYAVEHLHVSLIVVLGHTQCGAVKAAVAGGELPGHLPSIVQSLRPAVEMAVLKPGDPVENGVRINARLTAAAAASSAPILSEEVKRGELRVVPARYDLATGKVDFLD